MVHLLRKVTRSHLIARHFFDQTRLFTTQPTCAQAELLLRDYLHRSLYDPSEGYFTASKSTIPVGSIGKSLEFNKLLGQAEYLSAVKQHYNHLQASWLTPSEIFTPYYGCAIANFILDKHSQMAEPGTPLRIFEIGGGTGTMARDILDHLRSCVPDVYRQVDYRMVEISPILAQLQETTIADVGGHREHFQVECRDAADLHGWESSKGDDPCFLLLMEVLDNCPHDRVHRESPSQPWLQTAIREHQASDGSPSTGCVEEVLQPLSDELIQQCLGVGPWEHNGKPFWHRLLDWAVDAGSHGAENTIFLPTGSMKLLDTLIKARPFHCILAADFDQLPETRIPGKNAPLVATTAGGKTTDHSTYLVDAGSADIFFPTDFYMLERMYGVLSQRHSASEGITTSVLKNEAFMKRYASIAETTTVQGYNPLMQDYSNTSFFVGQHT